MPTTGVSHDTARPGRVRGRAWAYTGAILGGTVSIAANIAHSYIPPTHARPGWTPDTGAVIGSVFWPLALFVAIEILTRVPWPAVWYWVLARFGGLLPVALVAAVVSYRHLSGLLEHYGENSLTVVIGPLAVDGLMVMATSALMATAHTPAMPETPLVIAAEDTTPVELPAPTTPNTTSSPAQPVLAPWATPTTPPPARVNGHTPAQVTT
jgi:hypothetical protein